MKYLLGQPCIVVERTFDGYYYEWDATITQVDNVYIETKHRRDRRTHPQWTNIPNGRAYEWTWTKHYLHPNGAINILPERTTYYAVVEEVNESPSATLGRFTVAYLKNGFVQIKWLVRHEDYLTTIKPKSREAYLLDLQYYKTKDGECLDKANGIRSELKSTFGASWFTDKSPLFHAIETGYIDLPSHQGGKHPCKVSMS